MAKKNLKKKGTKTVKAEKLQPPKKQTKQFYDFIEVERYLEKLHKKNFRDYAGKFGDESVPYQDFWHWICDCNEVSNGGFIHLPDFDYHMNNPSTEAWKKEILQYFHDFLGDDYNEEMRVSW